LSAFMLPGLNIIRRLHEERLCIHQTSKIRAAGWLSSAPGPAVRLGTSGRRRRQSPGTPKGTRILRTHSQSKRLLKALLLSTASQLRMHHACLGDFPRRAFWLLAPARQHQVGQADGCALISSRPDAAARPRRAC
jgi:hypothetical protein